VTQYSERELVLPALVLLDLSQAGLTTSDLIRELTTILRPDGHDGEILADRNDTYFSQKVRNLVSHRTLEGQNALADWVRSRGMTPLRPGGGAADFDLAWDDGATLTVAEVKSLTRRNETGQLRLGLGQVLHYAMLLSANGRNVRAVLATERAPTDRRWIGLCAAHGVVLVWSGEFDRLETLAAV
jgi:hypothetical protein